MEEKIEATVGEKKLVMTVALQGNPHALWERGDDAGLGDLACDNLAKSLDRLSVTIEVDPRTGDAEITHLNRRKIARSSDSEAPDENGEVSVQQHWQCFLMGHIHAVSILSREEQHQALEKHLDSPELHRLMCKPFVSALNFLEKRKNETKPENLS